MTREHVYVPSHLCCHLGSQRKHSVAAQPKRPNILFILLDDLRVTPWLRRTPASQTTQIDRIARSVNSRMRLYHVACSPSRDLPPASTRTAPVTNTSRLPDPEHPPARHTTRYATGVRRQVHMGEERRAAAWLRLLVPTRQGKYFEPSSTHGASRGRGGSPTVVPLALDW